MENPSPPNPDAWCDNLSIQTELINRTKSVAYSQILGDNQVLFLGENHGNSDIRVHLATRAAELRKAGITHFAIEAADIPNNVERLKDLPTRLKQENIDLSWINNVCPNTLKGRPNYDLVVKAMAQAGIEIVPIDVDQTNKPSRLEREAGITRNISSILEEQPNAKIAVLIGEFHTLKKYSNRETGPSANGRLLQEGIKTTAVNFVGGSEKRPTMVTDNAKAVGLANKEWMIDMNPYNNSPGAPGGSGEHDYMIHLPQKQNLSEEDTFGGLFRGRLDPFV